MATQTSATALAAAGVAAALGLLGALDIHTALKKNPQGDPYRIEELSARYAPAAAELPKAIKVVGYLTDSPVEQTRGQLMFFSAQYALAPRLLSGKPDQEWVLGNFAQAGDWEAAGAAHGLKAVRDLKNGLVLFQKAPRP